MSKVECKKLVALSMYIDESKVTLKPKVFGTPDFIK